MTSSFFGKSLIKWGPRPDMTFAIDWDVKHHFKRKLSKGFEKKVYLMHLPSVFVGEYIR